MTGEEGRRTPTQVDKERVTAVLREHMGSGRLSLADYRLRLARVRAAGTVAELEALLHDLPGRDSSEEPTGGGGAPAPELPEPPKRGAGCAGILLFIAVLCLLCLAGFPSSG